MSIGRKAPRAVVSFEAFKEVLPLQSGVRVSVVWVSVYIFSAPSHYFISEVQGHRGSGAGIPPF